MMFDGFRSSLPITLAYQSTSEHVALNKASHFPKLRGFKRKSGKTGVVTNLKRHVSLTFLAIKFDYAPPCVDEACDIPQIFPI